MVMPFFLDQLPSRSGKKVLTKNSGWRGPADKFSSTLEGLEILETLETLDALDALDTLDPWDSLASRVRTFSPLPRGCLRAQNTLLMEKVRLE